MRDRIALFRARDDATRSAGRLRRLGFSVACIPAVEIVPLPVAPIRAGFDAVLATSAKAFLTELPLDNSAPLYVVGTRTAREAQASGWRLAAPPSPDVERLIVTLMRELRPGARALYLAGRDRKPAIEAALVGRCALEVVEAYAAQPRTGWRADEIRALASCRAALHYSRRSAKIASRLALNADFGDHFARILHVCISCDVAQTLKNLGAERVISASAPDEDAMLAALCGAMPEFASATPSRI